MKTPPYLKEGDQIGLVSPARKISMDEIRPAIKMLQKWGLEPVFGNHIFSHDRQFGGTIKERASDFQYFLDNPGVKAIMATRGGYGSVQIIDHLDFKLFERFPKWLIGYSDFTVFHNHVNTVYEIETLHATMPINFDKEGKPNSATESLRLALFGEKVSYDFKPSKIGRTGEVEAEIIGGNLSIIYSLMGSKSSIDTDGKILFLEDLDEYLYHIDRMMTNLKRAGKLEKLAGLIVGGMNDMNDNTIPFGKTAEEIIEEQVAPYHFPVVFGFPAGHISDNRAILFGRKANLKVQTDQSFLSF